MSYKNFKGEWDWDKILKDFPRETTDNKTYSQLTGLSNESVRCSVARAVKRQKRLKEVQEAVTDYFEKRNKDGSIQITDTVDRKLTDDELFERYGRDKKEWRISMVWFKDKKEGFLLSCCFIPLIKEKEQDNFKNELIQAITNIAPYKPKINNGNSNGNLLEIDIFDPHFGKLAWRHETGEDYDIDIAKERYHNALYNLLNISSKSEKIERIIFPVGNDLLQYDTMNITTTAGTRQDTDSRFQKMWLITRQAVMEAIEMCQEVAPVDIPIVPSNHDFQTVFYLGDLLDCYYSKNKNVNINNSPKSRKYYKWGNCGIGYTHGNEENVKELPLIMMREQQKEWADVEYMEWHIGHHHRKKQLQFVTFEDVKGILIRYLRSISSADAWHYLRGYVGAIKGAESFVWNKKDGLVANFMHNL